MKKLIMFVMVLMLCLGTTVKADPVAAWCFSDTLGNAQVGGDYPATMYAGAEAYDSDGAPPGGSAIALDGTNSVELPLGAANPLDHTADWSIAMWFKVPELAAGEGAMLLSSSIDNTPDNHSYALFLESGEVGDQGALRVDMFWVATVLGDTVDLDDGEWHHVAAVFDSASGFTTLYLDGVEDGTSDEIGETIPNIADNTILIGDTLNEEFPAEEGVEPLIGSVAHVAIFAEALDEAGVAEAMNDGFSCYGPPNPIKTDPNVMTVYEAGTTEGDFEVGLKFAALKQNPPNEGTPVTVNFVVDPNCGEGPNPDITLLDGAGPMNRVTFSRTGNDLSKVVIRFKAIDDEIPEPPTFDEEQCVLIYTTCAEEPNFVCRKILKPIVMDNDQADILFRVTPPRGGARVPVIGPVQLWEQPATAGEKWRKIGIQLQVQPSGDPVKLQAVVEGEIEGDNLPPTDPCLPFQEADDPNCFTFTSTTSSNGLGSGCPDHDLANKTTCWNVDQDVKIWGNDDAVLQVEGASADGDEDYHATLVVTVIDGGGDARYQWTVLADPCEPGSVDETFGLERTVDIDIEDNECGAFGILPMDISNRYYETDPNYAYDDPDCYVDIHDAVEVAKRWLDCTDPKNEDCFPEE